MRKKIDINSLTKEKIEKEIKRTKYNSRFNRTITSTIIVFIVIAAIGTLVATFLMPVLQINTDSMNSVYKSGDIVVAIKTTNVKPNDIVAYYHGNKILVSRVIGIGPDSIDIDNNGLVYRNYELLNEEYASNIEYIVEDIDFPIQIPMEELFVLNDNRSDTTDSRDEDIGNISKEDLIGKIIFKVWSK